MNGGCVQRLQHSSRGGEGSEQKNNGPGRKEQEDENQSMAQLLVKLPKILYSFFQC